MRIRITVKADNIEKPKSGLFAYITLLTFMFVLLEIAYVSQFSGFYFGDFKFISDHLHIPLTILPGILFYLFSQGLIHFSFILIVWSVTRLMAYALQCTWKQTQTLGFYIWGLGLACVLLANQYYFPNSKFADFMGLLFNLTLTKILLLITSYLCFTALLLALVGLVLYLQKRVRLMTAAMISVISVVLASGFVFTHHTPVTDASTSEQPNIIVIGVDALRPDVLGFFGKSKRSPHIDEFLRHSTVFTNAITPIARTFPAWVSLLTGQYPTHSGARTDLMDQTQIKLTDTLPRLLQQQGYETMYAIDETRFSNIGENFGFDHVVSPPTGLNDFLLGTFNDFPLSNLIVNTPLGRWLFPSSYGNRPAYATYDPNSFLKLLTSQIQAPRTKPLFIAVHFCLPHYPYFWASYSSLHTKSQWRHYLAAVKRADKQVDDFLSMLKQNGVLEHSIVVLVSDHGEALELAGDRVTQSQYFIAGTANKKKIIPRFYPPSFDFEKVNQSGGHGTDVLGLTQYRIVLAFRTYGTKTMNEIKKVSERVSLLNIKPSILDMLKIPYKNNDGVSLRNIITGNHLSLNDKQDFFVESDFSPESIHSVHPETRKVLFEGIAYYQIDPLTTHFTVKKSMLDMVISSKQHADMYGDWMLALYPQAHHRMTPILINLKTKRWTNDLNTSFAQSSPAEHMLHALKKFYGKEISS